MAKSLQKNSSKDNFCIFNETKEKTPKFSVLKKIKERILPSSFSLNLIFLKNKDAKKINFKHRGKNKIPNVLSFNLSKKQGEIFIAPQKAKKDAHLFLLSKEKFLIYLFIHALCHLKGMEHSSKMDREENKIRKIFKI